MEASNSRPPSKPQGTIDSAGGNVSRSSSAPPSNPPHVLNVLLITEIESDPPYVEGLLKAGMGAGVRMERTRTVTGAARAFGVERTDAVLLDGRFCDELSMAEILADLPPRPIIVLGEKESEKKACAAIHQGAQDYLAKRTLTPPLLANAIRHACARFESMNVTRPGKDRSSHEADLLYHALEHADDAVMIMDIDGVLQYVNAAFERVTHYSREEVLGRTTEFLRSGRNDEAFFAEICSVVKSGNVWKGRVASRRKDGSIFEELATISPVYTDGEITNYVAVKRDITAEASHQAEVRHRQKLESIGTLASGVAHEVNNPLNAVLGYAELLAADFDENTMVGNFAREIVRESERIAETIKNLLSFSQSGSTTASVTRVRDLVSSAISLTRTVLRHDGITLLEEIPGDIPSIYCNSQQIQQVLLNLLTNAREALNRKFPEGHQDKIIRLSARKSERDGREFVQLTVEDQGSGIPAELMDQIFDPFFTTKGRDKGAGLGLYISQGIVRDHGGELKVETEHGTGTRFHLLLPASHPEAFSPS